MCDASYVSFTIWGVCKYWTRLLDYDPCNNLKIYYRAEIGMLEHKNHFSIYAYDKEYQRICMYDKINASCGPTLTCIEYHSLVLSENMCCSLHLT